MQNEYKKGPSGTLGFLLESCLPIYSEIKGSVFNLPVGYQRYVIGHLFLELDKKQDTMCEAKSLFDVTLD